jgi:hypothetical protein
MNFLAGPTPAPNNDSVDWATDVQQGVCRPGCNSDLWITHGGLWSMGIISGHGPFIQVPPAKPGSVEIFPSGEWCNTTIVAANMMIRSKGLCEEVGSFLGTDGHYYWKIVRTWTSCQGSDPTSSEGGEVWQDWELETVVGLDGQRMLDDQYRSFSLCRWVRSPLEHGALTLFENTAKANPELGWDNDNNPCRALAVSQTVVNPGQVTANGNMITLEQPPPPPSYPQTWQGQN